MISNSSHFTVLKIYWEPFEVPGKSNGNRASREGTWFDDVLNLYRFDRKLRFPALDAIEVVEVVLRTIWANDVAEFHAPQGYMEQPLSDRFQSDYVFFGWRR